MTEALDLLGDPIMFRDARFRGEDRIELIRHWGPGPSAFFLGCNPSTANGLQEDPTSRWLIAWCQLFGFGRFSIGNLYPFCTSSPAECRKRADWESNGPDWYARDRMHDNVTEVARMAKAADQVFVIYGAIAWDQMWVEHVIEHIQDGVGPWPDLWCLGKNADGSPKHPMARGRHRIPVDQKPILWRAAG